MDDKVLKLLKSFTNDGNNFCWIGHNNPGTLETESGLWVNKAGSKYYGKKGFQYSPEISDAHFEWGAVIDGEAMFHYGEKTILLREGMYYLMNDKAKVSVSCPEKNALIVWFEFQGHCARQMVSLFGNMDDNVLFGNYSVNQIKPVLSMAHILHYHPSEYALAVQNLLWRFIAVSRGAVFHTRQQYSREIEEAVEYIESQPLNNELKLETVASKVFMSVDSFRKRFKKETGSSPSQYYTNLRIVKAKEMLLNNEYTVKQIASSLGFSDPYYFSRLFKKYEGVSPELFRKEMYIDGK